MNEWEKQVEDFENSDALKGFADKIESWLRNEMNTLLWAMDNKVEHITNLSKTFVENNTEMINKGMARPAHGP